MAPLVEPRDAYTEAFLEGLKVPDRLTVSEWADRHRVLSPRASAEHGAWRTSRTPYLREIMDCLSSSSPVREVVVMAGAQTGKTECGNNWVGYVIDHMPGPMLYVQPTVELVKRVSKQRIDPMIQESPNLRRKVSGWRSRDSSNTVQLKEFPGGVLIFTGANSAVGLRSMPARFLFFDECDAYPGDVEGEGDPIELAEARARTFAGSSKVLKTSTPTIEGRSRIAAAYERSDRSRFHMPCPECGEFFVWVWKLIRWDEGDPRSARLLCEACGTLIEEGRKTWMLGNGIWVPEVPELSERIRGFHLSGLCSPVGWFSWGDAAEKWEEAQGQPAKLRVFVNTVLAETWKEKGEAPEWQRLYNRRSEYKIGTVPEGGILLTAGIDVQRDRLELEVVAWGHDRRSWSVEYFVLPGDTAEPEVWAQLEKLLARTWPHENGKAQLPITMAAVDSGFQTQAVYAWVRKQRRDQVIAIKGREGMTVLVGIPKAVEVKVGGRRYRRGLKLWSIGVDLAKSELYGWLRMEKPTEGPMPPGWCHFPEYPEEWFRQLCAEQIVARIVRGYRRYVWELTRERNEALDCRVYARAAASVAGLDRWSEEQWDRAAADLGSSKLPRRGGGERKRANRRKRGNI